MPAIQNPFYLDSGTALSGIQSGQPQDNLTPQPAPMPQGPRMTWQYDPTPEPAQTPAPTATAQPQRMTWQYEGPPVKQEPEKPASSGGFLSDIGHLTKLGVNQLAQDTRELVSRIPGVGEPVIKASDTLWKAVSGKTPDEYFKQDDKEQQEALSPEMKAAGEKKWWDSDKGRFGDAWLDPRAYVSGIVQSAPEQLITMVPAVRLAKFAYAAKIAAGATPEMIAAGEKAAAAAAGQLTAQEATQTILQTTAAKSAAKAAQIAGSVSEGALAGAQSSRQVRDKIMEMTPDQLQSSDAYKALLNSGMSPDEAKATLANDSASKAFLLAGVTTGIFGGMGDRVIARTVLEGSHGLLARFAKGAIGEGVFEEFPQSYLQQVSENAAMQAANPKIGLTDDAMNQALGGLAVGSVQGGAMAAAMGRKSAPKEAKPNPDVQGTKASEESVGTSDGFTLSPQVLQKSFNEQPEFVAAMYNESTPEQQIEIKKAIDRMGYNDAFAKVLADPVLMQSGKELLEEDRGHTDFMRQSWVKVGETPPESGTIKFAPKTPTESDVARREEEIRSNPVYQAAVDAEAATVPVKIGRKEAVSPEVTQDVRLATTPRKIEVGKVTGSPQEVLSQVKQLITQGETAKAASLFRAQNLRESTGVSFPDLLKAPETPSAPYAEADKKAYQDSITALKEGRTNDAAKLWRESTLRDKGFGSFTDLQKTVFKQSDTSNADIAGTEEDTGQYYKAQPKATGKARRVADTFAGNYEAGGVHGDNFRRLLEIVVGQKLQGMDVGPGKPLTGAAREFFDNITGSARPEFEQSLVAQMYRTMKQRDFDQLVAKTGKEPAAEYTAPTPAQVRSRKFAADVQRVMLRMEQSSPYKFTLENMHRRLDDIYNQMNGNSRVSDEKKDFVATTRAQKDEGGIGSMEAVTGTPIKTQEDQRVERVAEAAQAQKKEIEDFRDKQIAAMAQNFRNEVSSIRTDISRLYQEALAQGADKEHADKVRAEALRSVDVIEYDLANHPVEEKPDEPIAGRPAQHGVEMAHAIIADHDSKKLTLPEAVREISEAMKEGEFTIDDLIAAFRDRGRDVNMQMIEMSSPVAARNNLPQWLARNGFSRTAMNEWLSSFDNLVKKAKELGLSESIKVDPYEAQIYRDWLGTKEDTLANRRGKDNLSDQSYEDALGHLLFNKFTLDEMRDFSQIKDERLRQAVTKVFGDEESATKAWYSDVEYAEKQRPDLFSAERFLNPDEVKGYREYEQQQQRALELRAKMIDRSMFYIKLNELIPPPFDGGGNISQFYRDRFPNQQSLEAAAAAADALRNQFLVAGEQQRMTILRNADDLAFQLRMKVPTQMTGLANMRAMIEDVIGEHIERVKSEEELSHPTIDRPPVGEDIENKAGETEELTGELQFGNEEDDDGVVLARTKSFSATPAATVNGWVQAIKAAWKGGPEVKVLARPEQLDEPIRSAVMGKLEGTELNAKGMYVTNEGTVYIFSDHIENRADAEWTLFHEVYGHFGLRAFLGKSFDQFLETVYKTRPEIRKAADAKISDQKIGKLEAVEEVLSDMAGDAKHVGAFKAMVGKAISWLRSHGFESVANWMASKSDAEVAFALKSAKQAVQQGIAPAFHGAPFDVRLADQKVPYELFSMKDGNTNAYARFDPLRNVWYVFNAINGDRNNYNLQTMQSLDDVRVFMRKHGKLEERMRSSKYVDNKLISDLAGKLEDYRNNASWIQRKLDWLVLKSQNQYLPVFKILEQLEKHGRVTDKTDIRKDLSGLYERTTAQALEQFRKKYVDPITDLVAKAKELGATEKFINQYAIARHADERNIQVKKINPSMENGSGMSKEIADGIMADAKSRGLADTLEKIGELTDRMSVEKTYSAVAAGMLHPLEAERWLGAYKHYVNLSGLVEGVDKFDDPGAMIGRKFNVRGATKRALGRGTIAPDVLARTIAAAEGQIIRNQKNLVGQRLLELMENNYDPNFVSINRIAKTRQLDKAKMIQFNELKKQLRNATPDQEAAIRTQMDQVGKDGFVQEVEDQNYINNPNVMVVKVHGIPVTMEFKQTGKGSFAEAIHGVVHPPEEDALLHSIGKVQRTIGQMITTYNPVWIGVNFIRDAQTLFFNAAVDKRIGTQQAVQMTRMIPSAAKAAMFVAIQDYHPTTKSGIAAKAFFTKMIGQPNANIIRSYNEARESGALVGFIDRKGLEQQIEKIHASMTGDNVKSRFNGFLDFLEVMTTPIEQGPRLAAYMVTRENGWNQRDAAVLAGDITVNFNMRGQSAMLRNLYLFFNPAVQGTAKLVQLAKDNPARFATASAGFIGLGMLMSFLGRCLSGDDDDGINKLDKVPDFKRATSLVFKADMPGLSIPIPYGWNAFFAAGTFALDTAIGAQPLSTTAKRIATATWESSLPIGASGFDSKKGGVIAAAKTVTPTMVLPIVEWMANENRYGGPIKKGGFPGQAQQPDSYSAFRSTNPISRALAEGINNMTGGHRFKSGAVDFNPAIVDHLINSYLPGFAAETYKAAGFVTRVARGEEVKNTPLPVLDRFTAKIPESWDATSFMRVKELVDGKWQEFQHAPSPEAMDDVRKEYKGLGQAKAIVDSVNNSVRKLEANYQKVQTMVDRKQVPESDLIDYRNRLDEQKKALYHKAIKAAMQVGEGDNHPIRNAILG